MGLVSITPIFTDDCLLEILERRYDIKGELSELPGYVDLNRKLISSQGDQFVVKVANIKQSPDVLDFENQVMNLLAENSSLNLQVPILINSSCGKQMIKVTDGANRTCLFRVISFLEGDLWAKVETSQLNFVKSLANSLAQVDKVLANFDHPAGHRYLQWDIQHANVVIRKYLHHIKSERNQVLIEKILFDYEARVLPLCASLPVQIIHNDANDYNLMVEVKSKTVSGLFDFGDMISSYRIAELAIATAYAVMHKENVREIILTMVRAYHQINPLIQAELSVLLDMIKTRLAVSLCISGYEYSRSPENEYILVSQQGAWQAIKNLNSLDHTSFSLELQYACRNSNDQDLMSPQAIIAFRKRHLSENLSLAYKTPLKIVAGRSAYLYDEKGRRYLDMVNNVCHVGHCHPEVVSAGQKQMAMLNTNTRYLHQNIVRFSEKLLSTMPPELSVCMLVNSGSEANELALRLARTHTNRRAMIVVEGAYHGNTNACIDISPYKFNGSGGKGCPDWVKQTLVPDPYRGKFKGANEQTGKNYSLDVQRVINEFEQQEMPICGFICESIQGVGGQIVHPSGYLKSAYDFVRQTGGVCIADEVQVGMGRVGSHWWAFQSQEAIPDIVTIGKPLGNGHPLAAVVTTQEIADSFASMGMEYFNTFGGNPVSCAIGTAVFDVIEQQGLRAHALEVGNYLQQGLVELQHKFPIIGDVRGLGLFIGVEFVKSRKTLEPAVEQINFIIERLKDKHILLTTDGPFHNVLKIKPPLVFLKADARYFLTTLEQILNNLSSG